MYHNGEATVNENCEIVINILLEAKNKHIPKIMRKHNKCKDKKEKWTASELLNQINLKNDMYVEWKSQSTSIDIYNSRKINFKTFERIVNKNIDTTKIVLYHGTFNSFKNNIKKTWTTINDTLGRGRKQSKSSTYIVDNEKK